MHTMAVVMKAPGALSLSEAALIPPGDDDVVVAVEWSGISTGTERLLWEGRMPTFPGMGYPLVPGYETVGRIVDAGANARSRIGERVFAPGARCYQDLRGLFGGAAGTIVAPSVRATTIDETGGDDSVLLALAATARHALRGRDAAPPQLIVGHGVLGRLLARVTIALGNPAPVVWERNPARRSGAGGYDVVDPADDDRRDYSAIYDASGAADLIDTLIARLSHGGELVLAGFYDAPVSFAFPPAFMREARLRVAAEWRPEDLDDVLRLVRAGALSLAGLITHRRDAQEAADAYPTAFEDSNCLKMVLDWRKL